MRRQPHAGGDPPSVCHGSQCRGKKGVRLPCAPEQGQQRGRRGVAAVGDSSTPGEAPQDSLFQSVTGFGSVFSIPAPILVTAWGDPLWLQSRCSFMGRGWCCHRAHLAQSPFSWLLFSCCQRPIYLPPRKVQAGAVLRHEVTSS